MQPRKREASHNSPVAYIMSSLNDERLTIISAERLVFSVVRIATPVSVGKNLSLVLYAAEFFLIKHRELFRFLCAGEVAFLSAKNSCESLEMLQVENCILRER